MTASVHLQLRAAIAAALNTAGLVRMPHGGVPWGSPYWWTGSAVLENRNFSMPADAEKQVHVNLRSSEPLGELTGRVRDWASQFELTFLARKSDGQEAHDVADALWVAAYDALMADHTLGGMAWELLPGDAQVETDELDTSLCRLTWVLVVHHRTLNETISTS